MDSLQEMIVLLSEEEQKHFIQFLKTRNKRKDSKNVTLFKALIKERRAEEIVNTLYHDTKSRNAYHGLRKRLHDNVVDFISNRYMNEHNSEEIEIIQYLILARYYLEQSENKVALKILKKAEQKALEHDAYSLLNEIYFLQIQYAHETQGDQLAACIALYEHNKKQVEREEKLNIVYAVVRQRLAKEGVKDVNEIIDQVFKKYQITIEESLTFRSLYQLMVLLNMAAANTRDYYAVTPFMNQLYNTIANKYTVQEKALFYHIEVLYLMANLHCRNKDFTRSLAFLEKMSTQMQKRKGRFFKRFELKYECLKALNYHYIGEVNQAIAICEHVKNKKGSLLDVSDIQLSLAVYYFSKREFKQANRCLNQLTHSDAYYEKKIGLEWAVKKILSEVLIYIENEKPDLAVSRLQSFQKRFQKKLEKIGEDRVNTFVKFILSYINYPEESGEQKFSDKIKESFIFKEVKEEDLVVMSFFIWLKSKVVKEDFYKLLVETLR